MKDNQFTKSKITNRVESRKKITSIGLFLSCAFVSVVVLVTLLILILPAFAGADSLWLAMPVTELLVMICAAAWIGKYTKALPGGIAE